MKVRQNSGERRGFQYVGFSAQANEAPRAQGATFGGSRGVQYVGFVEYQHVDISAKANEANEARGLRFGKDGVYQHVDAFTLTGPSNPFLPYGTFRASADPRKIGRKKGQVDIMRLIGRKKAP